MRIFFCLVAVSALVSGANPFPPDAALQVTTVLERARQAVGGGESLRQIRDVSKRFLMTQADTGAQAEQLIEIVLPSAIRLTNRIAGQNIVAFCCDGASWASFPFGMEDPLPEWQQTAASQDVLRQLESLLLSDEIAGRTVEYLKAETVDGQMADVLRITDQFAGEVRLWIDRESGEPRRLAYQRITPSDRGPAVTDFFSEYRAAGKLRIPFKITTLSDDKPYMETVVDTVKYNAGLKVAALSQRPSAHSE